MRDGLTGARHAVYFAPAAMHPLSEAGARWLGTQRPAREGVEQPWRYRFHATLRPPMRLREDASAAEFETAVRALAARTPAFVMPELAVGWLGDFLALRPVVEPDAGHPLHRLAQACVRELDAWRAPIDEAQIAKRLAHAPLDAEQQALLRRWGYPHVLNRWRFHMTLSNSMPQDAALRGRWAEAARRHFADALTAPLACDALCVFVEPSPGAVFELVRRVPLAAKA
ncbi:DUF1045 domain-containing protein [Piscinibacter sp. XHJ-5]|uniref:DUF1045 domain-containing protein n=1 Tax=Piscinibacter sp. XHJ-5 TaxID=3037797 RepID=UPI00245305FE|nr:DUF1045 domain-containing protein [Piscinibacter sp. XHJ-5]